MSQTPTLHNSAQFGAFAPTVLMPGDPLRARFIAQTYLDNAKLVNDVRGIQGYTGQYKGKKVSVMASGMGIPTMGIYSYELFNFYGVEQIIRVGSAGAIDQTLKLRTLVAGMSAYSNSNYGAQFGFDGNLAPCADFGILLKAYLEAQKKGVPMRVGPVYSTDSFYDQSEKSPAETLAKLGVLAVEMEAYGLYLNAARAGKKALALLTISDNPRTGESVSSQEVRESFTQMMEIALEIA
ncbi:MAG: purine-nucleoside phosphorylase [Eubacteriales bacterium]|jgi:purine-nucleoside phosphorylase|nr:purine-nucleoside phosphorylase [Eubacteriales bacterium]MDD4134241.1 purine-nucleoside phosphorylase [Eubacteriales bacterium]NLO13704.1 purine-nucleoside phosphorylase [Clostridiales bacterium]